jgi:hypothetical protein
MKRWRDLLLIVGLFGLLIVFIVYGPGSNEPEQQGKPGSAHSAAPEGALGLQRWLQTLGYDARNLEYSEWRIPDEAAVLFILDPGQERISAEDSAETLRWVRNGGTLVLAHTRPTTAFSANELLDELQATVVISDDIEPIANATARQPLLSAPPVVSVPVETNSALELRRDDYLPLLTTRIGDSLVGVQEGRGYIYLTSTIYPFTNEGLQEPGSAPLLLNLLARAAPNAIVLFDEYHHGYRTPPTIRRVALQQGWGWTVLYTALVVGMYIVLTGRRFGRPVPLRADVARRSSAEYVQSLAMLFRRAGKQSYVLTHYHSQLKRRLARPYGFAPPESDDAFVAELQRYRGINDDQATRLRSLLAQLSSPASEEQLVRLVRAADAFADEKGRIR